MYLLAQKYIKNRPSQVSSLAQCLYTFETLIACHDDGLHVKYVTSKAYQHNDQSLQSRRVLPTQDANDGIFSAIDELLSQLKMRCT